MRNYCTLGDARYLPHLICMIDSIIDNFNHDYKVHVLGLDQKVFDVLSKKYSKNNNIKIYQMSSILSDFDIRMIQYLPPGKEAIANANSSGKNPNFVQFCWALAPCFSKWIMENNDCAVTYIDADILFFNDIEQFFKELNNKSIGFVRHRIDYIYTSGEFNVGIVHFNNDGPGKSSLKFWCDVMKNPHNPYSLGYGTCGDQKYLEAINSIYRKYVAIVDEKFGHLAPWNVTFHKYNSSNINKVIWNNHEQDLVYFHFAHFVWNDEGYKSSYNNEWIWGEPIQFHENVKKLYDYYYSKMQSAKKEIS